MYLLCDEKRVYVSTNYRVEAYDKPTLVNSEEKHLLWKSEKLKENLNKLVNAKDYIYGIGKNLLVRVGKTDGSTEELVFNEDLVDIFCTYSDLYFLSKSYGKTLLMLLRFR
jgi:protein subunit release factor A